MASSSNYSSFLFESEFSSILTNVQSQIDEFPGVEDIEPDTNDNHFMQTAEDALIATYEDKIKQLHEDVNYLKNKMQLLENSEQKKALIELELSKHYNCSSRKDVNLESIEKQLEWTEDWTGIKLNNVTITNKSENEKSAETLIQLEATFKNVQFKLELNIEENKLNPDVLPLIAKVDVQILQATTYELTEIIKRFKKTKSVNEFIKNLTACIQSFEENIFE